MRLSVDGRLQSRSYISIHAPIVGCDTTAIEYMTSDNNFNPRTHRGVRLIRLCRGARKRKHFNPRTHRGVRQRYREMCIDQKKFQSTHPSWGATHQGYLLTLLMLRFQSTHPSWGATNTLRYHSATFESISIHAPIVGCDLNTSVALCCLIIFQSTHPSWGATFDSLALIIFFSIFQSTHPSWGATYIHR